jgi:hypothetical protein
VLGGVADPGPDLAPGAGRVEPEDLQRAGVGRVQPEQHPDQRGLAGAVGAEQAGDPRADLDVGAASAVVVPQRFTRPEADTTSVTARR